MLFNTVSTCLGCAGIFALSIAAQTTIPPMKYRLILADEGNGKVHYVNLAAPSEKWSATCSNRDLQLIGNDLLMVSDNGQTGYSELDVKTGAIKKHVSIAGVSSGINSAFKLTPQEVYCARDGSPAKIMRVDSSGKTVETITLSIDASVRICRPTAAGTFLVGGKTAGLMCEFDAAGKKIAEMNAGGEPYMAVRLTDGTTLISTGYGAQMVRTDKQGKVLRRFPDEKEKKRDSTFWKAAQPNFFAGFQILDNGNIVVANWEGHGIGHGGTGYQLLEFDSSLTKTVSYLKQDAALVSSLHGVLVLDNLDTKLLNSDVNGVLQPIGKPVHIGYSGGQHHTNNLTLFAAMNTVFDLQGRNAMQHHRSCGVHLLRDGANRTIVRLSAE